MKLRWLTHKAVRVIGLVFAVVVILLGSLLWFMSATPKPTHIQYGMTFSTTYAEELGLDWHQVYDAMLSDLQVRHLRLAAYWPMVEPTNGTYDFSALDYQVRHAHAAGADIIMAVGRRLPRWPECHVPGWALKLSTDKEHAALLDYITKVVTRYRGDRTITYWQVENEPFLTLFAPEYCGSTLDEAFLKKEIALVHKLDPSRPVLVTDSGNLGTWAGAYHDGDAFGTSVYVYFWTPHTGPFRTILPPWFYRVKSTLMHWLYGNKETMLIELSAEPWLVEPTEQAPISMQLSRMDIDKFHSIIDYARETRLPKQYLWGVEWWYWIREHGHPEFWDYGRTLFHS